ncbi:hypothetical protein BCR43DRAFT_507946 [Syncephalastrum racemosum]|uniref:Uncharacterized protein n=1 Tax=Syncephalastrum racemosum TaxID=13706 RepID=A0A1X2H5I8_SYNRA|nr:hypothetical protein BCR43DRAFT_507946 [Syncephalastrum racemosum]
MTKPYQDHDQVNSCQGVQYHSEDYQEQYHMGLSVVLSHSIHKKVNIIHDQVISAKVSDDVPALWEVSLFKSSALGHVTVCAAVDCFTCFCQCRPTIRNFSQKAVSRNMSFGNGSRRWLVSPKEVKYQTVIVHLSSLCYLLSEVTNHTERLTIVEECELASLLRSKVKRYRANSTNGRGQNFLEVVML